MEPYIEYTILYITLIPIFFMSFTPYFTRKTESFGVMIPMEIHGRDDFKSMRRKFTVRMLFVNTLFTLLFIYIHIQFSSTIFTITFTIGIFVLIILFFIIYLPFHRQMKKIKQAENWVFTHKQQRIIDTNFRKADVVHSYAWYVIPFFVIIGTIIYTFILYDHIPNQVPTHTGPGGVVTYSEKSPGVLIMLPIVQLFMLAIMIGCHYVINISKQSINVANPKQSKQQNKTFRRYWSMFLILTTIGITLLFSYLQLAMIHEILFLHQGKVILVMVVLLVVSLIILSMRTGQGGSRLGGTTTEADNVMEADEDNHWIFGQIYFNREDPTIFVEKRFGIGWTVNFARPITWIIFLILLTPLFIPLFI